MRLSPNLSNHLSVRLSLTLVFYGYYLNVVHITAKELGNLVYTLLVLLLVTYWTECSFSISKYHERPGALKPVTT